MGRTSGRLIGLDAERVLDQIDRLLNVLIITDDDVEAQNRVTLSALASDGPVAKVEFHARQRSARTLANREFLARKAAELLRAAGAREVYRIDWPPLILHVQSTMRMGHDPADSVLDENAESRWVRRLFVADNSALPNGLGGPNPTLSNQAVATRTAEEIFIRYFGGEAWVGRESPVSSIDEVVTRAVLGLPPEAPVVPVATADGSAVVLPSARPAGGMGAGVPVAGPRPFAPNGEPISSSPLARVGPALLAMGALAAATRQIIRFRERTQQPAPADDA